jgi:hypothetical protein
MSQDQGFTGLTTLGGVATPSATTTPKVLLPTGLDILKGDLARRRQQAEEKANMLDHEARQEAFRAHFNGH